MGLQLIIGNSGSGKTTMMYQEIIDKSIKQTKKVSGEKIKFLAIVPEQFTMETQKQIVNQSDRHGTMDIDILSFDRLAKRIFEEAGKNTLEVLDDTGKCLILRKIIEENKDKLTVFGGKVKMSGFVDEVKSIISELYQYGIGENELKDMLKKSEGRPLLNAKLKDIYIIMNKLREYLADRFVMNEELLVKVCELIPESKMIKDSYITFDEYTGFSPVQYRVIGLLLKYASKVSVALTIRDGDKLDYLGTDTASDVFGITIKTVNRLKNTALDIGAEIYSDIILNDNKRFSSVKEFCFLEENLFKYGKHSIKVEDNDCISVHVCANSNSEADYVACTIKRLIREENYRFKDIAVVTADIENYHRAVSEAFDKHDIPCFIDYKRTIISNPMVESIRAMLEIITDNYSYESVFRFLKCGMTSIDRNKIDKLENYVISRGIRGYKKYSQEFDIESVDINEARADFMKATEAVYDAFKKSRRITVREAITALYNFTLSLNMENKLGAMEEFFKKNNNLSMAKEYAQTYGKIMALFDKTVFLIGEETMNARELSAILDAGFEDIKVGIIPPALDRVVVGDIQRTRLNNVKILFLVGANDGAIPKSEVKGGIFTQTERNYLSENDVELSPTSRENVFIQKYYLYLMMTKMSDKLYISFKRINGDGSSARQSYIINTIMKMFDGIKVVDEENTKNSINTDKITNENSAKAHLAKQIRDYVTESFSLEEKEFFRELYSVCIRHNINPESIVDAAVYEHMPSKIDRAIAKALYGENLRNSVSRLERFAACAYQHFINYGLCLQPRKAFEINSADIGSIYHGAIEAFSRKIAERNISWDKIDDELRNMIMDESVNEAVDSVNAGVFEDNARNAFMVERIKKMSKKTAWILQKQIMSGDFIPGDFEIKFSSDYGLDELKYVFADGSVMGLKGVIDRVDYYNDGDDIYVKVVDYKSGSKKFEINDVYNGLQLQLVLYLEAAMALARKNNPGKNVIPAGIFYYKIDNPVVDGAKILAKSEVITAKKEERYSAIKNFANNEVLKTQRVDGIFNERETVLKAFDNDIEELVKNGGESLAIPLGYTKKGGFTSASKNVTQGDLERLVKFVHEKAGELGEDILSGKIDTNPYIKANRKGNISNRNTPCTYCEYSAICGFDRKTEGCSYRTLFDEDPKNIWEKIRKEGMDNA